MVSYTLDVWGLNRRTVESVQAQADTQRFAVEAAWLTLTSNIVVAATQEASLRGQIEATHRVIDINKKMLDIMRKQFETGYANRSDLAAQEVALAQVEATLPPLERQLAIQRDLLTALAGRFPSDQPSETFRLADMKLPVSLPVSLTPQCSSGRGVVALRQCTSRRGNRQYASESHHYWQPRLYRDSDGEFSFEPEHLLDGSRQRDPNAV
jgi:outer membrane protein TolC